MTLPTPVSDQIVTPTRHTHILEDNMPSTHRMSRYKNMNRDDKSEDGSPTNQQTVTPLIAQPNFSDQATVAKPATDADVTDNDSEATNPDARSEILKWYERITRLGSNTSDSVLTPCKSQAPSSGAVGKTVRFTEKPRRDNELRLMKLMKERQLCVGENSSEVSDPASPTGQLCQWIASLTLDSIPEDLRTRAKYLILDSIAYGLKAARALFDLELSEGPSTVIGYDRKISALNAAVLNSSFIQGFELDDWHFRAPLHSNSLILPALLATSEHVALSSAGASRAPTSGQEFILAYIAGLEIGPQVGLALHGTHMLSMGWHSGAVFGPSAAAASVSKLLSLSTGAIEDAFGIACTQAGGLMSAQFESEAKRMQHGFAARNGLLGAMLARAGYVGIKRVFEREYGGFLKQFSGGNGMEPQYKPEEIFKGLSQEWQMNGVAIKPYATMAGTHNTIDCLIDMRKAHPEVLSNPQNIDRIVIELSKPAYEHGGWTAKRPIAVTGAQMSNSYAAATYIVDNAIPAAQFAARMLDQDEV
ncbi:Cis-aconitate decarboxylase-like protein oryM [Cladobotryum mycophilum]|uniref:Cis-aconitate decarboxylase-like protein oryM n=1 Tax=Cladobotryum mycophilum TaxID=491253 RepID=A0ABR0SI36_9HYPO